MLIINIITTQYPTLTLLMPKPQQLNAYTIHTYIKKHIKHLKHSEITSIFCQSPTKINITLQLLEVPQKISA